MFPNSVLMMTPSTKEYELTVSDLEPLVALPHSVGNVKSVRSVAGKPVQQAMLGSSPMAGWKIFKPQPKY